MYLKRIATIIRTQFCTQNQTDESIGNDESQTKIWKDDAIKKIDEELTKAYNEVNSKEVYNIYQKIFNIICENYEIQKGTVTHYYGNIEHWTNKETHEFDKPNDIFRQRKYDILNCWYSKNNKKNDNDFSCPKCHFAIDEKKGTLDFYEFGQEKRNANVSYKFNLRRKNPNEVSEIWGNTEVINEEIDNAMTRAKYYKIHDIYRKLLWTLKDKYEFENRSMNQSFYDQIMDSILGCWSRKASDSFKQSCPGLHFEINEKKVLVTVVDIDTRQELSDTYSKMLSENFVFREKSEE
jgi:hypothetical protein